MLWVSKPSLWLIYEGDWSMEVIDLWRKVRFLSSVQMMLALWPHTDRNEIPVGLEIAWLITAKQLAVRVESRWQCGMRLDWWCCSYFTGSTVLGVLHFLIIRGEGKWGRVSGREEEGERLRGANVREWDREERWRKVKSRETINSECENRVGARRKRHKWDLGEGVEEVLNLRKRAVQV